MRRLRSVLCVSAILLASSCFAQKEISSQDNLEFSNFKSYATSKKDIKMIDIFSFFKEKPYVAGSLELNDKEDLIINLQGLDCSTFVENALSLYLCHRENNLSIDNFKNKLQFIRYREGKINNYTSRLHYSSDWIYENQKKGIITDLSKDLGGVRFYPAVSFMSSNPDKYKALKDGKYVRKIKEIEDNINEREYYYIPKDKVASIEMNLIDGDIIFICTDYKGLDIAHVGFAIKVNGKTHLLHASSTGKMVMVSQQLLSAYLASVKHDTGIIVCRLK